MYRCQVTGRLSKPGEACNKIVVETRARTYKHWDREAEEEWFSQGTEIVREITATQEGVETWNSMTPEQQVAFIKTL